MKKIYQLFGGGFYNIGNPPSETQILQNKKAVVRVYYVKMVLWVLFAVLVEKLMLLVNWGPAITVDRSGDIITGTAIACLIVASAVQIYSSFNITKTIKMITDPSPLASQYCSTLLLWMEEYPLVKTHVQEINKAGRTINTGDYHFLSHWVLDAKLEQKRLKQQKDCKTLHAIS